MSGPFGRKRPGCAAGSSASGSETELAVAMEPGYGADSGPSRGDTLDWRYPPKARFANASTEVHWLATQRRSSFRLIRKSFRTPSACQGFLMMRVFCNLQRDVAGTKVGRKNSCLTLGRPLRQRAGCMTTLYHLLLRPQPVWRHLYRYKVRLKQPRTVRSFCLDVRRGLLFGSVCAQLAGPASQMDATLSANAGRAGARSRSEKNHSRLRCFERRTLPLE